MTIEKAIAEAKDAIILRGSITREHIHMLAIQVSGETPDDRRAFERAYKAIEQACVDFGRERRVRDVVVGEPGC